MRAAMLSESKSLTPAQARYYVRTVLIAQGDCQTGPINGKCASVTTLLSERFQTELQRAVTADTSQT